MDGKAPERAGAGDHQGKTTVAEPNRAYELSRSEVAIWAMRASEAWRTPYGPSPRMCVSNMSGSCRNCSRPTVKRC